MLSSSTNTSRSARTLHTIRPSDISKVLCHRRKGDREQYLVRWKSGPELPVPPRAICSWHDLSELTRCLHFVQTYIETRKQPSGVNGLSKGAPLPLINRKRKSPDDDPLPHDTRNGILTPSSLPNLQRSSSVISVSSSSDAVASDETDVSVYNGVLERKEGSIVAKKARLHSNVIERPTNTMQIRHVKVPKVNATMLPAPQMLEEAANAPTNKAESLIRTAFLKKLKNVPNLALENNIDSSTPSLNFTFITEYVLGEEVYRADPETCEGCDEPCRPNMGQNVGCEYPRLCGCLEYAAVNEKAFEREEPKAYAAYKRMKDSGHPIETKGLPKRFPYHKPRADENLPQTLVQFYRDERHPIYECNTNCKCGPRCKSRVVQKGRRVPLTIFKTPDRGWGVYCNEDLIAGEFIDTYLGEIITNAEADRREQSGTKEKALSYLYSLDKFIGDDDVLTSDNCYVVDGQFMGGPTRFINHSCEPNCRQYTVSYNKNDLYIYDLAFFAYEDIKAGMELTFDYMDKDEEEEEEVIRKREAAARDPENLDKKPCNCGARKCRGYLWV